MTSVHFAPADELLSEAPEAPDWVWEHTAARGAVTLFAGKPKVGKSSMTYELIEAVANHEDEYLGRAIEGGPVVYASEEGAGTLGGTFPRLGDIYLAHRESAWPKPGWQDLVSSAAEMIEYVGAVLCVIDTFAFWNGLGADGEKDAGSVRPLLDALAEITRLECAVWLVHHQRKSGGEDGDALRGSGAIAGAGAVDAFAELEKIENAPATHRRLVVTPRWAAPPVLVLDHRLRRYHVIGQAADREESSEVGWEDRVLAAIPDTGDGTTLEEIGEQLGADRRKWGKTLSAMIDSGRVTRVGKGVRGEPYKHLQQAVPDSIPAAGTATDGNGASPIPSFRLHRERNRKATGNPISSGEASGTESTDDALREYGERLIEESDIEEAI